MNVNGHEHVVGINSTADGADLHAVLWRDGAFTDLSALPGDDCSEANRINYRDQIVGVSYCCETGAEHAFLWEQGTLYNLNALISSDAGLPYKVLSGSPKRERLPSTRFSQSARTLARRGLSY